MYVDKAIIRRFLSIYILLILDMLWQLETSGEIIDPYVEIDILGVPKDTKTVRYSETCV